MKGKSIILYSQINFRNIRILNLKMISVQSKFPLLDVKQQTENLCLNS